MNKYLYLKKLFLSIINCDFIIGKNEYTQFINNYFDTNETISLAIILFEIRYKKIKTKYVIIK